jgi:hypothetical protein
VLAAGRVAAGQKPHELSDHPRSCIIELPSE